MALDLFEGRQRVKEDVRWSQRGSPRPALLVGALETSLVLFVSGSQVSHKPEAQLEAGRGENGASLNEALDDAIMWFRHIYPLRTSETQASVHSCSNKWSLAISGYPQCGDEVRALSLPAPTLHGGGEESRSAFDKHLAMNKQR